MKWIGKDNNAGMTLVELLAAMVIAFVVMMAASGAYLFFGNIFRKNADVYELDRFGWMISGLIKEKISFADQLEVSFTGESTIDGDHVIYFKEDGKVYFDGNLVYDDTASHGIKVSCEITEPDFDHKPVLKYSITATRREDASPYSVETMIELLNMEWRGESVIYPEEWDDQKEVYLFYSLEEE